MTPVREIDRARVGISSCLLGDLVRFDGGHKRNTYCADVLSETVEWVPVCPEVEVGMGTPREAVRLVGDTDQLRMIGSETGHDWTDEMNQYARIRVQELVQLDLDGYVLKSRSPSCGRSRGSKAWARRTAVRRTARRRDWGTTRPRVPRQTSDGAAACQADGVLFPRGRTHTTPCVTE